MRMEDIAKKARVSKSAVSLALSGKPGISEKTRNKILKIVRESGYVPRTMVKADRIYGLSNAIRFIIYTDSSVVLDPFNQQPFFMELIQYVEHYCRQKGYILMFSSADISNFDEEIEQLADHQNAGGILLLGTNLTRQQIQRVNHLHPCVVILDTCYESLDGHFVVMNNVKGAYEAARHLIQAGHQKIGYVQSSARLYNFDMRKKGFDEALQEFGLQSTHHFTVSPTRLVSQDGFKQQFTDLQSSGAELPTALFCECDYMAISVIQSLHEIGLKVPEDMAVIGFDNIKEATMIAPELTTVHVEKEAMALAAVNSLIERIGNKQPVAMKMLIDTSLVVRDSSR